MPNWVSAQPFVWLQDNSPEDLLKFNLTNNPGYAGVFYA